MNKFNLASVLAASLLAGCQVAPVSTSTGTATESMQTAATKPTPAATSTAAKNAVLRSFDFAGAPDAIEGWVMGWNKNDKVVIEDLDVEAGVGMKLSLKANASGWGDANIKLTKISAPLPDAVSVRLMIPAAAGRVKGLSIGCSKMSPWTEANSWTIFKGDETIVVKGVEYKTQELVCDLGSADPKQTELVLRFGGERIRYSGNLYIQSVKLLKSN